MTNIKSTLAQYGRDAKIQLHSAATGPRRPSEGCSCQPSPT